MQRKQLYASLEIAEDEIRLMVGEYHMSRFNILKIETMKCSAIHNSRIEKPQVVTATIVKLIHDVESAMELKIKSVILLIPSVRVKSVKRRVNVEIEDGSRKIMYSHIRAGLEKALDYHIDDKYEFVNIGSIKYIVGGISSRLIPIDEKAERLTMDVDLLYGDRDIVYSYVACVEKAGIAVLDICLDSFALAEESAVLENSMNKYTVLLDLEKADTNLSLYYKGRLLEVYSLGYGYQRFIQAIHRKYHLSYDECNNIIKENFLKEDSNYNDNVSFIWRDKNQNKQLTSKDIYTCVNEELNNWFTLINKTCEPLKELGECRLVLCGTGADIVGIQSILSRFSIPAQLYVPTTIGARKGKYTSCLGALYCTKKWQTIRNVSEVCIDFNNLIAREQQKADESAFTKKLKNILMINK